MSKDKDSASTESQLKQSYSLSDIASRWGVSLATVLHVVYQGSLRAIDVATNPTKRSHYIVLADDLAAFEKSRRNLPPNDIPESQLLMLSLAKQLDEIALPIRYLSNAKVDANKRKWAINKISALARTLRRGEDTDDDIEDTDDE